MGAAYLEKEALYPGSRFRMTDTTAIRLLDGLFTPYGDAPSVPLAWQGGEPTLMGLAFFQRITAAARARLRPGQVLDLTFQTNGLLLDDAWCQWLAEVDALVGLSIDGPQALHDRYRVDARGQGSFTAVEQAALRLRRYGVRVNAMVTVHAGNADHPLEIYRLLTETLGFCHVQLIPVVEIRDGVVSERSVDPLGWGRFLRAVFDHWLDHDVGRVFVPQFDAALASWAGREPDMCVFRETCGGAMVMEHNGDVYACDHFVADEHRRGNIETQTLESMAGATAQRRFGNDKRDTLPEQCRRCPVLFACRGECPKNRLPTETDGALNHLCAGYLDFFTHIDRPMRVMAELLRDDRPVPAVTALLAAEREGLPRHAPCPCESGRKYRQCHGGAGRTPGD